MRLRTRLLLLFLLLGVIPTLLVGTVTNVRNLRAIEDLVSREVTAEARTVAGEIAERLEVHRGALLFLAENRETKRLLAGRAPVEQVAAARAYLRSSLEALDAFHYWVEVLDDSGTPVFFRGDEGLRAAAPQAPPTAPTPALALWRAPVLTSPVEDPELGALGTVRSALRPDRLFPTDLPDRALGSEGVTVVVDRESGRLLYHPSRSLLGEDARRVVPLGGDERPPWSDVDDPGPHRWGRRDSLRLAVAVPIAGAPWSVVSTASVAEFAGPFRSTALANLLLIGLVSLAAAVGFTLLLDRSTASLRALTRSAERVASGDLDPPLPRPGRDEIGTLTRAFHAMLERIHGMIDAVRRSRQLAAVGEFSSQIAHEIRTPLTSIKLNLQGAVRALRSGRDATDQARPLSIALRETERLERVVRGVLTLGRIGSGPREPVELDGVVAEVLDGMTRRAAETGVELESELAGCVVEIDRDAFVSAVTNLLANALEACGDGGRVRVALAATEDAVTLTVADDGPGIRPELRETLFDPFVTSKTGGHGFGLALATRVAEAHGGTLRLDPSTPEWPGAVFMLEIPRSREGG